MYCIVSCVDNAHSCKTPQKGYGVNYMNKCNVSKKIFGCLHATRYFFKNFLIIEF